MKRLALPLLVLADLVLLASLAGMLGLLIHTSLGRIDYPFDLEWMEGGMLLHAIRVSEGAPLYVRPGTEFIPYIYPPLYPWLVGMLGRVLELGYPLARWISLLGTLLASLLMLPAIRREGLRWSWGLGAAALFLSCYDDAGAFFDLVRTDGLLVALFAGALVSCRANARWGIPLGGLLLAAAFATKHNAAMMGFSIAGALWWESGWRKAAWFALWSAVPALIFVIGVQIASDGLFLTYILQVPSTHPFATDRIFPKSEKELLLAFPLVTIPALLFAAFWLVRRYSARARAGAEPEHASTGARYWLLNLAVGIVMSVIMRGHHGGFVNVLIPGWWLVALCSTLGLAAFTQRLPGAIPKAIATLLCAGLLSAQVAIERWDPARYIPTAGDLAAGQKVLDIIASYPGEVLMPQSPYYPVMVGKRPSFALIALWDITHEGSALARQAKVVNRAIAKQKFDAIILSSSKFPYGLEKHYRQARTISLPGKDFYPKTGWRARPRFVYEPIPRETPEGPEEPTDELENAPEDPREGPSEAENEPEQEG